MHTFFILKLNPNSRVTFNGSIFHSKKEIRYTSVPEPGERETLSV